MTVFRCVGRRKWLVSNCSFMQRKECLYYVRVSEVAMWQLPSSLPFIFMLFFLIEMRTGRLSFWTSSLSKGFYGFAACGGRSDSLGRTFAKLLKSETSHTFLGLVSSYQRGRGGSSCFSTSEEEAIRPWEEKTNSGKHKTFLQRHSLNRWPSERLRIKCGGGCCEQQFLGYLFLHTHWEAEAHSLREIYWINFF